MRQRLRYTAWLLITLVLGFTSCTEPVDIELDTTYRRLVVNGIITTDSVQHRVELSTTSDYFSNTASPVVSGALVELEYDQKLILLSEDETRPGLYLTPSAFRGVSGTTYNLHIGQVDMDEDGTFESYHAESTMPGEIQLDSINLLYFLSPFVTGYQILMYALDPPTRDWYSYKIWKNQVLLTDKLSKFSVQPDDFFNGTYIAGLPVGFLSDDETEEALVPGDTVTLELNIIDQMYYNFITDAQLEIQGNNPLFSGPPANISSNIENEGRGIFAAYPVQRVSVILPQE